jgi:hypothetical protein
LIILITFGEEYKVITSTLNEEESSASRSVRFTPEERTAAPTGYMGVSQSGSGRDKQQKASCSESNSD